MTDTPAERRWSLDAFGRAPLARMVGYLSLFSFLVIVATLAIYAFESWKKLNQALESEVYGTTFYLAEHASRLFEATNLALDAAIQRIDSADWAEVAASREVWSDLRALNDRFPYIEAIWFNDAGGDLRLTTFTYPAPASNTADRDFFTAHLQPTTGVFVSQVIRGRVTDRMTFLLSRRLNNADGSLRGVGSVTVNIDYFADFYRTMRLPKGSVITLFRETDLSVVAQQPKSSLDRMRLPDDVTTLDAATRANPAAGIIRSYAPEGGERLAAYRKIQALPLFVSSSVPLRPLGEHWLSNLLESSALAVAALLALAGLTWVAFRNARLEQRLTAELEQQVRARTTEIEAANAQLATMFQEVHHRVKNNLQVITSLLRLQMARVDDPELKAGLLQSVGRVHAMSLVHQLLYSTHEITDLDFVTYLERLTAQFLDAYGASSRIRIEVKGNEARYSLNTAIPLALIVNELLSNAVKHAFPDDRSGRIEITVSRRDAGSEMTVCDDGPGFAPSQDWQKAEGLGLRIVRSLAGQIGGKVEMKNREPQGSCFVVTWPDEVGEAS